jgi:hypothetical protein
MFDPLADHDDPNYDPNANVRRVSSAPEADRPPKRAELRPLRGARRPPPRRGPDPRVWFVRGSIGIAALAGLWLGLQVLFPVSESRVSQAPTPSLPVDASAVGAPEPPAAAPVIQPAPAAVAQPAPAVEGDRLPGLPTPDPAAAAQAVAPPAQPAEPASPATEPSAPTVAPAEAQAQPEQPAESREETPAQQAVGTPTLEPIPPPPAVQAGGPPAGPAEQQAAQQAAQQARPAAVAAPPPAPKPQLPAPAPQTPPAAAASGGPFELAASASPANPISEQAMVTITVRATRNGAPVAGASCIASIYYRTATAKQPEGGFATNANGVGSFALDARGTTYGYYIPVDVTCTGRGGTATARTGFTPVRGR